MKPRRLPLKQVEVCGERPLFEEVVHLPGASWWRARIFDGMAGFDARLTIDQDAPEFVVRLPRKRDNWPSAHRVACAAAGQLNEARGLILLQRFEEGAPVYLAIWASNGTAVYCVRSTDLQERSVATGSLSPWAEHLRRKASRREETQHAA